MKINRDMIRYFLLGLSSYVICVIIWVIGMLALTKLPQEFHPSIIGAVLIGIGGILFFANFLFASYQLDQTMKNRNPGTVVIGGGGLLCVFLMASMIGIPVVMYLTGKGIQEKILDR